MEEDSGQHSGARIGTNEDLLTEVLIRLPVTSILRFKSVCKHWRLLLTHKHFTHRYDNNFSKSPGLFNQNIYMRIDDKKHYPFQYVPFDFEDRSPPPFRCLDFYFNRTGVIIRQSCNGLLLCYAYHNGATEYYVFNPTTKQLAFIPSLPKNILTMALAFHQTHCVHYKVVCICDLKTSEIGWLLQIQVYSSDTGKWKICIESFSADTFKFLYPVYWNGAVHWWAPRLKSDCDFLCYKLDVEQLQMLDLPDELMSYDDSEIFTTYFGESRGHLHLVSHTKTNGRILKLNVYEMLRDRSGWFVKYRVQFDELLAFPNMFYQLGVIDVIRGKEEEETFLVLSTAGKIVRYNVHDKSFNQIYSQISDFYNKTSRYHRYIEALSCF